MGLFDWMFQNNKSYDKEDNISQFRETTSEFLDMSLKLGRYNNEGGFIKVFFNGNDSGIVVCFMDSYFHQDVKAFGNDWKKFINSRFPTEKEFQNKISNYIDNVKIFIDNPHDSCTNVTFEQYYPYPLNRNTHKKWYIEYIQANYHELDFTDEKSSVIMYF